MKNVSEEYMLIMNLSHAAIDHKATCSTNCNVSLMQLKQAAIYIRNAMIAKGYTPDELFETKELISKMPIT